MAGFMEASATAVLQGFVAADEQLAIDGEPAALLALACSIEQVASSLAATEIHMTIGDGPPPYPYVRYLGSICVDLADRSDVVLLERHGSLRVAGHPAGLRLLATNLRFLATQPRAPGCSSPRMSFFWHEGHAYLARESAEVTIFRLPIDPPPRASG